METSTYLISLPNADAIFEAPHEDFPKIAKTPQQEADYAEIVGVLGFDPTEKLIDLTRTVFDDAERTLMRNHLTEYSALMPSRRA